MSSILLRAKNFSTDSTNYAVDYQLFYTFIDYNELVWLFSDEILIENTVLSHFHMDIVYAKLTISSLFPVFRLLIVSFNELGYLKYQIVANLLWI